MHVTSLASRAILTAYARKALRPFELGAIILFVLCMLLAALLVANYNGWWSLLFIPLAAYGVIGSIIWLVVHYTLDRIEPTQTDAQKTVVKTFVSQATTVADTLQITRFGLILRIIRDVMKRNESNMITGLTSDSKQLAHDFERVREAFRTAND